MRMHEQIEQKLREAFDPRELVVVDETETHRGHGGYQEGGESHWNLKIVSYVFAGQSRLARHRSVHAALGSDIMNKIHALALDLSD